MTVPVQADRGHYARSHTLSKAEVAKLITPLKTLPSRVIQWNQPLTEHDFQIIGQQLLAWNVPLNCTSAQIIDRFGLRVNPNGTVSQSDPVWQKFMFLILLFDTEHSFCGARDIDNSNRNRTVVGYLLDRIRPRHLAAGISQTVREEDGGAQEIMISAIIQHFCSSGTQSLEQLKKVLSALSEHTIAVPAFEKHRPRTRALLPPVPYWQTQIRHLLTFVSTIDSLEKLQELIRKPAVSNLMGSALVVYSGIVTDDRSDQHVIRLRWADRWASRKVSSIQIRNILNRVESRRGDFIGTATGKKMPVSNHVRTLKVLVELFG